MVTVIVVLIGVIVFMGVAIVAVAYDGKCKVAQWQSRYETVKRNLRKEKEFNEALKMSEQLLKEDCADFVIKLAELRKENSKLQERLIETDIERQKQDIKNKGAEKGGNDRDNETV